MKILEAVTGPLSGETYALGGSTTIGRDGDADIQLIDGGVSRRHACLTEHDDGTIVLYDLGSRNGTRVGGKAVESLPLAPGDRIEIGDTTFEYRDVPDGSVAVEQPDMKLMSGPAMQMTVMDDSPEAHALYQAARRLHAKQVAAPATAAAAAPATCCDSPQSAAARANGWAHCPACGTKIA